MYTEIVLCTFNQELAFTNSFPKLKTRYFQCVGQNKNSHHLIKCKLNPQIFLSSVLQTLVDLLFKQILNLFPITCYYFKNVTESFNRDSLK